MRRLISILVWILPLSVYAQTFDLKSSIERGKKLYMLNCSACHMADGKGMVGTFPPLVKNENLKDKARLINVLVKGIKGPIKVNGVNYQGQMINFSLTDDKVADLANYILNSWGNKEPIVLPKEVQPALKTKVKNYQPYKN